jgi:GntR family transcriptional regulator of abcA and norABC
MVRRCASLPIELDRESEIPLYAQIRDAIRVEIHRGRLKPGDRLPSVTTFAKQLGVTASTVLRALEELVQDGEVVSQVGCGTFVAEPGPAGAPSGASLPPGVAAGAVPPAADPAITDAIRRMRQGVAGSLEALNTLAERPGLIRFNLGVPDTSLIDQKLLRRLVVEATRNDEWDWESHAPPAGLPDLRETVAERLSMPGQPLAAENVLITSGCQQGISLVAQAALENRRRILCEMPCYCCLPQVFSILGHWVESVTRDLEGPVASRLEALRGGGPALLYLCPDLNNPQGTDLSPARRALLLDWAEQEDVLLLADEVNRDLRFEGEPPESLLHDAESTRALRAGSLSKSFMCGLRIGWVVGNRRTIQSLVQLKHASDVSTPPLTQAIALQLFRTGEYDKHLERAREAYRLRCSAALEALEKHMPDGVTWTRPPGGFHIWVELPAGYSSIALFLLAAERGVAILPGPQLDIDNRFLNAFRISVGTVERKQIVGGVKKLAAAVRELLRQPAGEPGLVGLGGVL